MIKNKHTGWTDGWTEISQLKQGRHVTLTLKGSDRQSRCPSKFHHKTKRYGPETNLLQDWPLTLTEETGILLVTRRLV